jgi:hypothetical protein
VGFEPGMQKLPDLCASAITTAPRRRLAEKIMCLQVGQQHVLEAFSLYFGDLYL